MVKDDTKPDFDLGMHIHHLLKEEPFFAKISRFISKVPDRRIPTAGVRLNLNTINFELAYNPDFFEGLSHVHRLWVLMHEFYHIGLGHCTDRRPENVPHNISNIGMDEAINSLPNMIVNCPEIAILPGRTPSADIPKDSIAWIVKDHPQGETAEWYIAKLMKQMPPQGQGQGECQGGEGDSFDDHSGWQAGDGTAEGNKADIAAHKIREIIKRAVEECDKDQVSNGKGWGSVSQEMRTKIKNSVYSKLDPKKVLGFFIKNSIRADRKKRITKINRRWAYIHPGRAWDRRPKIAISIDQSGSVDDTMLGKFFGWLNEFSKFADFTVIPFDDRVFEEKVYIWKKGQNKVKERVLCGGTNFDAPTTYVNENGFDGHIILTDMCAPAPIRSKCQRMWITDRYHGQHPYFVTNEKILIVD